MPKPVESLIKSLRDDDAFVRNLAARALGNIRDAGAAEPLIKALGDRDPLVRRSAAQALGSIGIQELLILS
jgi:HEAT repeat protein